MSDLFKLALTFSLRWEGGEKYTNIKDDPGGETKYGISKRAYPDIDIKSLTLAEAEQIYYNDYWLKAGCDKMDKDLGIVVFDAAVNCGVGRTKSWLAELKEKESLEAGKRSARWMIQRRIQYYKDIVVKKPALNKFLKGWLNRVNDLSKYIDIV
jgi:lysozyme family protein